MGHKRGEKLRFLLTRVFRRDSKKEVAFKTNVKGKEFLRKEAQWKPALPFDRVE